MQNCGKKEIGINTNLKDKLAEVIIEPGLIKDVIRIILTNAANHSPVKGSITIKLTEFEDKLELEISNPGKGFEPDKLKNITAFLMKDGLNLRSEWPGMHFSVIKFVMDLHSGQVQISNPDEGGAMVKLIFPINAMKNKAFSEALLQLN
jgi:two-component system sensor histidine kinase QseC